MNKLYISSKLTWFWSFFLGFIFTSVVAHAATIFLEAYVLSAIKDIGGTNLVDGSIVQIIGSDDADIDPFPSYGDGFLATPGTGPVTTPDDVFIGQVTIDSAIIGAGTFYSADFSFDSDQVTYLYLRVFDSLGPLTGSIDYGFSGLIAYTSFFGVAEVDFGSGIATTNNANFYIIPEPGSGSLLLVFMTLLFGVRYSMRSRKGVKVALPRNSSLVDDDESDWL